MHCCKKWGHLVDTCLSPEKKPSQVSPVPVSAVETKTVTEQVLVENVENQSIVVHDGKDTAVTVNSNMEGDGQWITPPKSGSSLGKRREGLKYGDVSILSNSFSALVDKEEAKVNNTVDDIQTLGESTKASVIAETDDLEERATVNEEETAAHDASKNSVGLVDKPKGTKPDLPLRASLPRGPKTAHKTISNHLTTSARVNPKDQNKKTSSKTH